MAYKTTLICDRCGHEETGKRVYDVKKTGWNEVEIKLNGYAGRTSKEYLLCPKCCESLGIADKKPQTNEEVQTVAERLMDCIVEIVAGVIPND